MNVRTKINSRMDKLQEMMESNHHLEKPEEVVELLGNITFAWEFLSEEDQDYIHGCRRAIEKQMVWK